MNTYYLFSELLTTACTDTDNESSVQKLTRRPEAKIIWSKLIQDRLVLLFSWITLYLHYIKKNSYTALSLQVISSYLPEPTLLFLYRSVLFVLVPV